MFPLIIILGLIGGITVLAIIFDSPLIEALARRIEGRGRIDSVVPNARVDALEKEVQYLNQSLEELREETEFVRALVSERGEQGALGSPPQSSPNRHDGVGD